MSIHRTKQGTYRVRWRESGRLKSRSFVRKIDADKFEATLTLSDRAHFTQRDMIRFSELVIIWLRDYAAVHKTASSRIRDESMLRSHILPAVGHKPLNLVTSQDIDRLQAELLNVKGQAARTVNSTTGLVHKIFKDAIRWGYIRENPVDGLKRIKIPDGGVSFWTFDELDRFLVFAARLDPALHDLALLAANTGMRKGEISGLMRDCVDYDNRRIVVKRNYCKHSKTVNEYTKGKKVRLVPMNDAVWKLLHPFRLRPPTFRLFPDDLDHVIRRMARIAEVAEVKYIRFHDLRHTFGSLLGMSAISPFFLKEMMGHSEMATTMRYVHLDPNQLKGVTDVLDVGKRKLRSNLESPTHELRTHFAK